MEKLINGMLKLGCQRERMEIKVFGGANVTSAKNEIGTDNGKFVLSYLETEGFAARHRPRRRASAADHLFFQ